LLENILKFKILNFAIIKLEKLLIIFAVVSMSIFSDFRGNLPYPKVGAEVSVAGGKGRVA